MTSITKELRELAADPLLGYASQKVHAEAITVIADRIDAELAGRYVELPTDANGETIHVGDDMETLMVGHEGEHSRVEWISMTESGWEVDGDAPSSMRHYQPDTWERIVADACGGTASEQSLIDRCKALAGDAE